jgi:hypothetical protein
MGQALLSHREPTGNFYELRLRLLRSRDGSHRVLEHGFMRVRCTECHREKFVAFSCKRRGCCPSCGARRMVESAALLVDQVLPAVPMRQWVLSVPFPLRFLFASDPVSMEDSRGAKDSVGPPGRISRA